LLAKYFCLYRVIYDSVFNFNRHEFLLGVMKNEKSVYKVVGRNAVFVFTGKHQIGVLAIAPVNPLILTS
jgi:hypothetical protein